MPTKDDHKRYDHGGAKNPSYYNNHAVKTCIKQDMIADILESAGVPARRIKEATTAVKYIDRLGEKDPVEIDSFKASNYLYRFLTGHFIGEDESDAD